MHMRNAICTAILVAFISALSWALGLLSRSIEFSSFMIFGVVTVAIMVTAGYAWDYYERRRSRQ
jgi:hypothetical protein